MQRARHAKVFFIGAGPGDPELITVKGQRLIREADLVLYAGSLVPRRVVACAKETARVLDSSSMTLQETHAYIMQTVRAGGTVARVHTGDPSLYGAVREQILLLKRGGVDYEVVPGVSVAFAAAARAGVSFTLPGITQSLILTRVEGKTPVPPGERLKWLASHGCSIALYLSTRHARPMAEELIAGGYPGNTLVFTGYRIGWPEEQGFFTRLADLAEEVEKRGITRQAVFLVLPGQEREGRSRLYDPGFRHGFRGGDG